MIYQVQYTHTIKGGTEDVVEQFEADDDSAVITEANNRFPEGATNKKLFNIGDEVVFP